MVAAGVLLAGFGVVTGTSAAPVVNPVEVSGNVTTCAKMGFAGSTQYNGNVSTSVAVTALFTVTVTSNKFVTISSVAAGVTFQVVVLKGGDGYNVYNPPVANMQSPLNGGGNIPDLSHWFACYTDVPAVTTPSTTPPSTTPPSTTPPSTTPPSTTPPSTTPPSTTLELAVGAATSTTTEQKSLAPLPTTTERGALPITGNGRASGQLLLLGFLLMGFGSVILLLSRRPVLS